jgi:uncharacterized protein YcbX
MATVAKLQIAPVKGLALVHPPSVELDDSGVPNNRRFFLVGPDGRHRSGLAFGPLAAIVPSYDVEREVLSLRFPDGTTYDGDACAVGEQLEVPWASRMISARELQGPWAAAFTDYMGMPMRLVRAEPGQNLQSRPVSMVSTASLDELERASDLPEPLDDRRFRMLVTIDGVPAWEEEAWIGRDVAIGDAVVNVELRTQRCATTTRDPATGLRDWDALRAVKDLRGLSAERTIDFGVYATVVRPGRVAVGDKVVPDG